MKRWNYARRFRREFDLWDEHWEEPGPGPDDEEWGEEGEETENDIDWDSDDD